MRILTYLIILPLLSFSCKKKVENSIPENKGVKEYINKVDLIAFKVKEEKFNEEKLSFEVKNIFLEELSNNEYKLEVEVENSILDTEYYNEYYFILSIYPYDQELNLLDDDRQKYKFEMFSIKIRETSNNKIFISRRIKTKVSLARAVTLSLMEYKTKQKSMEIVMLDVDFLK